MSYTQFLKQAEIFHDLTPTQYQLLSAICDEIEFRPSDVIFDEGSKGTELYIIVSGAVAIQISTSGPGAAYETIAQLVAGDCLGEIALVDEGLRSARATCTDASRLLIIERERLHTLCLNYPALGYTLMRNLAADLALKIRNADSKMSHLIAQVRSCP